MSAKIIITILAIGIAIYVAMAVLAERTRKREIDALFTGRESIDDDSFFDLFFAADGLSEDVVIGVKRILEENFDCSLSRLKPDDDFSSNLNYFWQADPDADVDVFEDIEKQFGIKLAQADVDRVRTFRSLVQMVEDKVRVNIRT